MQSKQPEYSNHHIIGHSERKNFNVGSKINLVKLPHKKHMALHTLFWEEHRPKEQLKILLELVAPTLKEKFVEDLLFLLEASDREVYRKELLKK